MSKKKLKKLMKQTTLSATPGSAWGIEPAVNTNTSDALTNSMWNSSPMAYQIFRIQNGYSVVCHMRKYDIRGNRQEERTEVHYVQQLADIPVVMATTGAANAMGV